jgi:hypothetical protein
MRTPKKMRKSQFASTPNKRRKRKTKRGILKSRSRPSLLKMISLLPLVRRLLMNPLSLPVRRVPQELWKVNKDKNVDAMTILKVVAEAIEAAVDSTEVASEVVNREEAIRNHSEVVRSGRTALVHTPEEKDSTATNKKELKVPKP